MLRNYLTVTMRNLMRHKLYGAISVLGLALGLACCIFIMLWVQDELSYDGFHENSGNLYRVEQDQKTGDQIFHVNITPYPMAPALVAEISEITEATRFETMGQVLINSDNASFYEEGVRFVDPVFLRMFTFPLVKGDAQKALDHPKSIVISEALAAKYFGADEPVGKSLRVSLTGEAASDFQVTGVIKRIPRNSTFRIEALIPFEALKNVGAVDDSWRSNMVPTFVQLREGCSVDAVSEKITALRFRHRYDQTTPGGSGAQIPPKGNRGTEFSLLPVEDIHLYGYFGYATASNATQSIWLLSAIALFVLLIACINFMNLATARAEKRVKEVGLRKINGASRKQIAWQFYGESSFYTILGLLAAILIVELLLPAFNSLTDKDISLSLAGNGGLLCGLMAIALFSGAVAGSYPALFMSSLQPATMLGKGSGRPGGSATFRKVLVITQFVMSIFVIIVTVVIADQTAFMKETNLGYNRDNVLCISLQTTTYDSYGAFKNELLKDPRILGVSGSSQEVSYMSSNARGAEWDGQQPGSGPLITYNHVDYDFVETMGIEMIEGRTFTRTYPGDTLDGCLINEELARVIGKESAAGARFSFVNEGRITGVMKNFNFQPLTNKIEPLALYLGPRQITNLLIRPRPEDITATVAFIKSTWERVLPQYPFTYRFLDEEFDRIYRAQEQLGTLMKYFSALSIVIACLGLYGLAAYVSEVRTKEVGIRKSLGATVPSIVRLLSRDFLFLVSIAFVIALPLAWYSTHRWLQDFAYRVEVGWSTYILAGVTAILVAIVAVGYHAVKAATANPVDSLKYE